METQTIFLIYYRGHVVRAFSSICAAEDYVYTDLKLHPERAKRYRLESTQLY